MTAPSSLGDACQAHYPGDFPAVFPYHVDDTRYPSLIAWYLCWCGREWVCGWNAEAAGWPVSRTEAA